MREFNSRVERFSPDLVVVETSTVSIYNDWKIINSLKEDFDVLIAAVGPHVTALPEETLNNSLADFVLFGEYEVTLLELAKKLGEKSSAGGVAGLAYRKGSKIINNGRREPVKNLDELPSPAWHLFDMKRYNEPFCENYPNFQMLSSRGCVFKCSYCSFPQLMFGGRIFRAHSPERVVGEMEDVIEKFGPKEIYFDDDTFTLDQERIKMICSLIKKKGIGVKWSCMTHCGCVSYDLLKNMKEAGCVAIKFGIESGSQEILNRLGKGLDLNHARRVIRWCRELGIRTHTTFMLGLPGDTRNTMLKTIKLIDEIGSDSFQISIAIPYPGTGFYEMALKNGWLVTDDWSRYDGNRYAVVSYPNLPSTEIERMKDYVDRRTFLRGVKSPRKVISKIKCSYEEGGPVKTARMIKTKLVELLKV